jgi:ABC-type transport system involved in multi-copper enzyme maturation permease subunit
MSKMTVLAPVLLIVTTVMVFALALTDRLPNLSGTTASSVIGVLVLEAIGALALGLLASALVSEPAQATLALPMLCFPAVLFGGAMLPVRAMAGAGRGISVTTADRWAFEGVGRLLDLSTRFEPDAHGDLVTQQHGNAFLGGAAGPSLVLALLALTFTGATLIALSRKAATR